MDETALHGHLVGRERSRYALNTPALVVDLDALTNNIARMAEYAKANNVVLRPHAKTHKCPEIAKRQIDAGAIGACCAKLGEAEALADGGITTGLLLTSPIISEPAIARLLALHRRTNGLICVVDHPSNVSALARAFAGAGQTLDIIIDIDPGFQRTGVASADAAVSLFDAIRSCDSLRLVGVQFYCGQHQHIAKFEERRSSVTKSVRYAKTVVAALQARGANLDVITGSGTGTHRIDVELAFFTELQVGSYIFMDADYLACDLTGRPGGSPFETALTVDSPGDQRQFAGKSDDRCRYQGVCDRCRHARRDRRHIRLDHLSIHGRRAWGIDIDRRPAARSWGYDIAHHLSLRPDGESLLRVPRGQRRSVARPMGHFWARQVTIMISDDGEIIAGHRRVEA